jgi:hypothetical protein
VKALTKQDLNFSLLTGLTRPRRRRALVRAPLQSSPLNSILQTKIKHINTSILNDSLVPVRALVRAPLLSTTVNSIIQTTIKPINTFILEDSSVPVRAELSESDNLQPIRNPYLNNILLERGSSCTVNAFQEMGPPKPFNATQEERKDPLSDSLVQHILKHAKCAPHRQKMRQVGCFYYF